MGIPRGVARLLLDEARRRPFGGSLLQLARSTIFVREDELRRWAAAQGVALREGVEITLSADPDLAAQGCLSDSAFFELLGFDEVLALDVSDWESAHYIHDLNHPVPEDLAGRFDVVFDPGTTLHVFDQSMAFENIHRLLRVEGRVIHGMTASSNHVDLGFYMFSPALFHDYYAANRYGLETELFFEFEPLWIQRRFVSRRWKIYRYRPGEIDHLTLGGFGRAPIGLFVVATRRADSTAGVAPVHGFLERHWRRDAERTNRSPTLPERIEARLAAHRVGFAMLFAWKLVRSAVLRRVRRKPPVALRY